MFALISFLCLIVFVPIFLKITKNFKNIFTFLLDLYKQLRID